MHKCIRITCYVRNAPFILLKCVSDFLAKAFVFYTMMVSKLGELLQ